MRCFSSNPFIITLLLFTAIISGCSGAPTREVLPSAADRLIAKDFAQIVSQVERFDPGSTIFRIPRPIGPVNPFDFALREEFSILGYNIEFLSFNSDVSDPVISHRVELTSSGDGEMRTYTVSLSGASFRRGYAINNEGQVRPVTTMQAKGIESEVLRQDDSIFGTDLNADPENTELTAQDFPSGVISQALASSGPNPVDEDLINVPILPDTVVSASSGSALQGTRIVGESLLIFRGDSLVLGEENKRRVVSVVENYRSRSDVFSLLGCVRGEDLDWEENASELALGRTERIRSELRYAGIPNDKIKIEECARDIGAEALDLPADSVLLLLNRDESSR